jgi:sugar lactone lactonase YvrE
VGVNSATLFTAFAQRSQLVRLGEPTCKALAQFGQHLTDFDGGDPKTRPRIGFRHCVVRICILLAKSRFFGYRACDMRPTAAVSNAADTRGAARGSAGNGADAEGARERRRGPLAWVRLFAVLLSSSVAAGPLAAQGTLNLSSFLPGVVDAPATLDIVGGIRLEGASYLAQLFTGPVGVIEAGFVPVGDPLPFRTGANAGYFRAAELVSIPAAPPGTDALVQVRAWEAAAGASYAQAFAAGGRTGKSKVLRVTLGDPLGWPRAAAELAGLEAFAIVPLRPVILLPPVNQAVRESETARLRALVTGISPLTFQWYKDGVALRDGGRVRGASTPELTLTAVEPIDGGEYVLGVANAAGAATSAPAAILTVVAQEYTFVTLAAGLGGPRGVAMDRGRNLYLGETATHTIRRVSPEGATTPIAGVTGLAGGADGVGTNALFARPEGVAAGGGQVFVADADNHSIRVVTAHGEVGSYAGLPGTPGSLDGVGRSARFNGPRGIASDQDGVLYVADTENHTVRRIAAGGIVTTLAGVAGEPGASDGPGGVARFNRPSGVAVGAFGDVYVADRDNHTIRRISPLGVTTTLAGAAGAAGAADGLAGMARFRSPAGIAVDPGGTLFVTDEESHTVRRITPDGAVHTIAGVALARGAVDGVGTAARFDHPVGVVVDAAGTIYVADSGNGALRVSAVIAPTVQTQPQRQSVLFGQAAAFEVQAGGTRLRYQWRKDGVDLVDDGRITGTADPRLNIAAARDEDAGAYSVMIGNALGEVTSLEAVLVVNTGASGTLNFTTKVLAAGVNALVYLDVLGGTKAVGDAYLAQLYAGPPGLPSAELVAVAAPTPLLSSGYVGAGKVAVTVVGEGSPCDVELRVWEAAAGRSYEEAATNLGRIGRSNRVRVVTGGDDLSPPRLPADLVGLESFTLARLAPLVVLAEPQSQVVSAKGEVQFEFNVAGSPAPAYQWRFNDVDIPGATNATLTLTEVGYAQAGRYSAVARNGLGVLNSRPVELAVAFGKGYIYRWFYPGVPGETVATLRAEASFPAFPRAIEKLSSAFEGTANWADEYGSYLEGYLVAPLTGAYTLWVSAASAAELWLSGDETVSRLERIAACDVTVETGDWSSLARQESAPIDLEAGRRYYFAVLHKAGMGKDHVAVGWRLPDGTLQRPVPALFLSPVNDPVTAPLIRRHPESLVVISGEPAVLAVNAEGIPRLSYQWQRDEADMAGATNAVLVFDSVKISQAGRYQVQISNAFGRTNSATATLEVRCRLDLLSGSGGGVTRNPDLPSYAPGSQVLVTASPQPGFAFAGWSGDAAGTANPLTVTMDRNREISARFTRLWALTVTAGAGGGVVRDPLGSEYLEGTVVGLRAEASAGFVFTGWTGDVPTGHGSDNPLQLTMDGTKRLEATFLPLYSLAVGITGQGSVARLPDGPRQVAGTTVRLTATAAVGWEFAGWSGALAGLENPVAILLDSDKQVGALFKQLFSVTGRVVGSGTVTFQPAQASYLDGSVVTAVATPGAGYGFAFWSRDLSGSGNPTNFVVNTNKTISAFFYPLRTLTTIAGPGGSVARDPDAPEYLQASVVTLTARPDLGYVLAGWSGDATGTDNPLKLTMDRAKTVTATFRVREVARPKFLDWTVGESGFSAVFVTQPTVSYTIEVSTDLERWTPWRTLTATSQQLTITDGLGPERTRFYRLRAQ